MRNKEDTLLEIIRITKEHERSRVYIGVEVTRNSGSATAPPVGYVDVKIDGIGTLARYFGAEPSIGDYVEVMMVERSTPVIITNHSSGLSRGWPFDNTVKTDPANPAADTTTVAGAIALAAAGDNIIFGPATYTSDGQTLPDDTAASSVSQDKQDTILQTIVNQSCIIVGTNRTNLISHLTIKNTYTVDTSTIRAITTAANSILDLRDCYLYAYNASVTNAYARALYASGTVYATDCKFEADCGYSNITVAVFADNGGIIYLDAGCACDGLDYDVYAVAGGIIVLNGPVLQNGTIGGAGTITGWWRDTSGNLHASTTGGGNIDLEGTGNIIYDADADTYDTETADDEVTRYIGGNARMQYDDEGIKSLSRILEGVWYDYPLSDTTEGDHFRQNAATYPAGWTEVDAPAATNTNNLYSFWFIRGTSADVSWDYRLQTGITIESMAANAWASFLFGPFLFRDGKYTADVDYYFSIHGQTAAAFDASKYVRVHLQWSSAGSVWRIQGESDANDGGGQTASGWTNLTAGPIVQPLFFRVAIQNNVNKTTREYWGAQYLPAYHSIIQQVDETTTWGQVWWRVHQSRGAGIDDYWSLGAIDYLAGSP